MRKTRKAGEAQNASPALGASAAAFIGAAALVVRGVHLWQIHTAPFYSVLVGDARVYDRWALQISGGDWLGHEVFYQAPLYPYLLGLFYRIFGHELTFVRVAQAVGGGAACVLLASAVTRLFDRRAGIAAGLTLALYAPAIFFDGLIQKSALDALLVCVLIWCVSRVTVPAWATASPVMPWFWIGAAIGALALTRENALVLVPVIAVWIARTRHFAGHRLRNATVFAAGLMLLLAPVLARNASIGGGVYLTTAQAGPNFYIGNHPDASGMYQPLRVGRGTAEFEQADATALAERAVGETLTPSGVSAYWMRRAAGFIETQPGAWLALTGRKALLAVNAVEIADTEAIEQHSERSTILWLGQRVVNFGVLLPLAAMGVWFWRRRLRNLWVLLAMAGAYAASVIVFFVSARYRYPLVPFLIVFAAAGLASLPGALSALPTRSRAGLAATIAVAAVVANWPLLSSDAMRAVAEMNVGVALQADGRTSEAMDHYRKAVALQPEDAAGHLNLGTALHALGRTTEAEAELRTAVAVAPESAEAHFFLAKMRLDDGQIDEAIDELNDAVEAAPDLLDARTSLGVALASKGRFEEAIGQFRVVAQMTPASSLARWNLGTALAAQGDLREAVPHLEEAVRLDPSNAGAVADLAAARDLLGLTFR